MQNTVPDDGESRPRRSSPIPGGSCRRSIACSATVTAQDGELPRWAAKEARAARPERSARAALGLPGGARAGGDRARAAAIARELSRAASGPGAERHRRRAAHQPRPGAARRRRPRDAVARAARGYCDLEFDLATRRARRSRRERVARSCALLSGAEAALVVNNNAAAVLLALAALARGARGDRLARRAGRDRRLVPHARDHGGGRRAPGRGRHHQPHPPARLRARDRRRRRRCCSRCTAATSQLSRLRRRGRARRARRARAARAACPSSRTSAAARSST